MPKGKSNAKLGHVRKRLSSLKPAPENDTLYRPVDPTDPEIVALADSIHEHGLREPIVVSADGFIISGHRRLCACRLVGLKSVPVRVERIKRTADPDRFVVMLREYNRQRDKSLDEKLREEVVTSDPHEAYQSLIAHRQQRSAVSVETMVIRAPRKRSRITKAKRPMLDRIQWIIDDQRDYWPLSDRRIHYALLNDPPLKHASKTESTYANDKGSYKSLVELLTRARLAGIIPMHVITDETRPVTKWRVFPDPRQFVRKVLDGLLKNYWRDLQRSQPAHIEIVVEKNTVEPIIRPVAMEYCIPLTSGRGYCSLPPRAAIADRFERSGKDKLLLLFGSDFDPDGEEIAHSFARSMRDDFGIDGIEAVKVTLTAEQVAEYELPPRLKAKQTSSQYQRFADAHGDDVFELEAIPPAEMQRLFRSAIDDVMDLDAFNHELDTEREDAAFLDGLRQRMHAAVKDVA